MLSLCSEYTEQQPGEVGWSISSVHHVEGHRLQPDHPHFNTITLLHTHIPGLKNTTSMLSSDITIISTLYL